VRAALTPGTIRSVDVLRPVRAFDRLQRRTPALGFPLAVVKKFSDDQASHLAALIAYYGFFSIFPLLLVLVTGLGFVLQGNEHLYDTIVDSALGQFPVIGEDIQVGALRGDTVALVIGLLTALWAGLGVTLAGQRAMNEVWDVPHRERRNFLTARVRGLLVLLVLGLMNIGISVLVALLVGGLGGIGVGASGFALTMLLDVLLFWVTFRLLTTEEVPTRQLWLGIVIAAIGWAALQTLGGIYVDRVQRRAGAQDVAARAAGPGHRGRRAGAASRRPRRGAQGRRARRGHVRAALGHGRLTPRAASPCPCAPEASTRPRRGRASRSRRSRSRRSRARTGSG
jgi:YihY family inner membrane protein